MLVCTCVLYVVCWLRACPVLARAIHWVWDTRVKEESEHAEEMKLLRLLYTQHSFLMANNSNVHMVHAGGGNRKPRRNRLLNPTTRPTDLHTHNRPSTQRKEMLHERDVELVDGFIVYLIGVEMPPRGFKVAGWRVFLLREAAGARKGAMELKSSWCMHRRNKVGMLRGEECDGPRLKDRYNSLNIV